MMKTQLSKFLMVGMACTVLNYSTFLIFYKLISINFLIASCIGYIAGLVFGYYLNRSWTFESEADSYFLIFKYFLIYMISLFTSLVLLNVLVVKFSLLIEIASIFVIGYSTLFNYIGTKFLVFKK